MALIHPSVERVLSFRIDEDKLEEAMELSEEMYDGQVYIQVSSFAEGRTSSVLFPLEQNERRDFCERWGLAKTSHVSNQEMVTYRLVFDFVEPEKINENTEEETEPICIEPESMPSVEEYGRSIIQDFGERMTDAMTDAILLPTPMDETRFRDISTYTGTFHAGDIGINPVETTARDITQARIGDTVRFIGGTIASNSRFYSGGDGSGFTLGNIYILSQDYNPEGRESGVILERMHISGEINVINDDNGISNGHHAGFFELV